MVLDVIFTVMVQDSLAAIVAMVGLTAVPAATKAGANDTAPEQVVLKADELSVMLLRVSVKVARLITDGF